MNKIINNENPYKGQLEGQLEILDNHIRIYKDEIKRASALYNEGMITEKEYQDKEEEFNSKIAAIERKKEDKVIENSYRRLPSKKDENERIKMKNEIPYVIGNLFPDKIFHGVRDFWHFNNILKDRKLSIKAELGNANATTTGKLFAGNKDDLERIARSDMAFGASDRPAGILFVMNPKSEEERINCSTLGVEDIPLDRVIAIISTDETVDIILGFEMDERVKEKIFSFSDMEKFLEDLKAKEEKYQGEDEEEKDDGYSYEEYDEEEEEYEY